MENLITVLIYILVVALAPITGAVLNFVILPFLRLKLFENKFIVFFMPIIIGLANGFVAILFAKIIFTWFSLKAGNLILTLISLAFLQNSIHRIRTRPHTLFEKRLMFGTFLGIIIAASIYIWGYKLNQITIPLTALLFIIFIFARITIDGNIEFWELLSKYPIEGYVFLKNNKNAWFIIDSPNEAENIPKDGKWHGPFNQYLPLLDKKIKIYGKVGFYEKSMEEFINLYKKV